MISSILYGKNTLFKIGLKFAFITHMPMIEKPQFLKKQHHTIEIKISHLFVVLALFSGLVALFYHQADSLTDLALEKARLAEDELQRRRQENTELEAKVTDLLSKLTRLNQLYSASLKKTSARVDTIANDTASVEKKIFELTAANSYYEDQSRDLTQKLESCRKAAMSSSCYESDPRNPAIVRETIR